MLGIDFTDANGLSVDTPNRELFIRGSNVRICSVTAEDKPGRVCDSDLFELLDNFPSILTPDFKNPNNKHKIEHYIKTSGSPVYSRPRRLDQAKLEATKAEFVELEQLGIILRSDSPWASPLHVVPKANSKLRPCRDYRRLNEMTEDDKYPLPQIHDFNTKLIGAKVFSKVTTKFRSWQRTYRKRQFAHCLDCGSRPGYRLA